MDQSASGRHHDPGRYEIRVQGHLAPRWSEWFDGLDLTSEPGGTTLIAGDVVDQSALHGLLQKLRDAGLPLLSVTQVDWPRAPSERRGPA
jgi:hypothetical protein